MSEYEDSNVFEDDDLDEYLARTFPTERRIDPTIEYPVTVIKSKIIPSEIKFSDGNSVCADKIRYDGECGDVIFNNSAYYKVEQLDWIIQCLQQLKEMIK